MRLSLRLALVFSLYGLALAVGFQYLYLLSLKRQSYQAAEIMAHSEAKAIQVLIQKDVALDRWPRVQEELAAMIRQTGIASICVFNSTGRRLIGRADDLRWRNRSPHPGLPMARSADGFYDVESPLLLPRRQWGRLIVAFHTDALANRLRQMTARAVGSGVTAFLAITLIAWLMGTWFGSRLERLVPRIESLARDPSAFKPIKLGDKIQDEAGRLTEAFNILGASLQKEIRRRRELEEEKAELSAMLVHDLKSPLTVIRAGVTFVHEQVSEKLSSKSAPHGMALTPKGAGIEKTFKMLDASIDRICRMVEDVLQLSRMEEIEDLREASPVDIVAMILTSCRDFELVAKTRGQKISSLPPSKTLPAVLGDPLLLRRVLDNLIYNAIEHTPPEGTIQLSAFEVPKGIRVNVCDSGPGIPKEARKDIFKKFFQKEVKRHIGNVGLGLALCERVILRHGGSIDIEDAEPHGACFYFIVPAIKADRA